MEKQYGPLSINCARNLQDKLFEKRKTAALEIEKLVRDWIAAESYIEVDSLITILVNEFIDNSNPNCRKGGLFGIAAVAIGLGKDARKYTTRILPPVIRLLSDLDSRVRYFACESMYNIVKVTRGAVLPFFNDIFDALSSCAADPDGSVRKGSDLLDRLMKDIVSDNSSFQLLSFIPLLRERIYTKNLYGRQFIVSWISTLISVPDINLLFHLPDIIDGLFHIASDTSPELSRLTESLLAQFLKEMASHSKTMPYKVNFGAMVNIVNMHCQLNASYSNTHVQLLAMLWLRTFVALAGKEMLPFSAAFLASVLPCLHNESITPLQQKNRLQRECRTSKEAAEIGLEAAEMAAEASSLSSDEQIRLIGEQARLVDFDLADLIQSEEEDNTGIELEMAALVEVLSRHVIFDQVECRLASLYWLRLLLRRRPKDAFCHLGDLFPLFLKCLSDSSEEVVLLVLEIVAEVSNNSLGPLLKDKLSSVFFQRPEGLDSFLEADENPLCLRFLLDLLALLATNRELLDERAGLIIRRLAMLLTPNGLYHRLAAILRLEKDYQFAFLMVQSLNSMLLTSAELFPLREQLRRFALCSASRQMFNCLYPAWCHNAVATVSLCLLTGSYEHANRLVVHFEQLDITVELFTEMDRLIQLLESPIFTYLRLELLKPDPFLQRCLYGLLMCMPQTEAFHILRRRLECVPHVQQLSSISTNSNVKESATVSVIDESSAMDWDALLEQFAAVQAASAIHRRQRYSLLVQTYVPPIS